MDEEECLPDLGTALFRKDNADEDEDAKDHEMFDLKDDVAKSTPIDRDTLHARLTTVLPR
jgi:hypothetical protein